MLALSREVLIQQPWKSYLVGEGVDVGGQEFARNALAPMRVASVMVGAKTHAVAWVPKVFALAVSLEVLLFDDVVALDRPKVDSVRNANSWILDGVGAAHHATLARDLAPPIARCDRLEFAASARVVQADRC